MVDALSIARSELILGGQKSGKSRRAEWLAKTWLAASPQHKATLIATGQAWDEEMHQRIVRHQRERAERVPGLQTLEEPRLLAEAIAAHSHPDTLLVVDCLTLWLTNWLMPFEPAMASDSESNRPLAPDAYAPIAMLLGAIRNAPGPLVRVGNELGLGVIPMGREVRAFVDALGRLNQDVAQACARVTLMAAGLPLTLKGTA